MMYDYMVVGAGLFGAVFAHEMTKQGKKCLVIDKRDHIGGNCYTKLTSGIQVHQYGAHIFHTNDDEIWAYMRNLCDFKRYTHQLIANYNGELFSLPFCMRTFNEMWGVNKPAEAKAMIEKQKREAHVESPATLEEQALSMVGKDIYEKLVKWYTEKQWGRKCSELPPSIIKRLPVRFTFDSDYFGNKYEGIPIGGYTQIFEKLLEGCTVELGTSFDNYGRDWRRYAKKLVYTGSIDEYYGFIYGSLDYRSVRFEHVTLPYCSDYQGCPVMNYTDDKTPWTRIIEHKHFEGTESDSTVISREYSVEYSKECEPCYPINDEKNNELYARYLKLAECETDVLFGGRLGQYKYLDMDATVREALNLVKKEE